MATVSDLMVEQRAALRAGKSLNPGPPVLIEAATGEEVVLTDDPAPAPAPSGQRWTTQRIELDPTEIDRAVEARMERMLRLQPLISDDAAIHPLEKRADSPGENIFIDAKKVPFFKAGKAIRERINDDK